MIRLEVKTYNIILTEKQQKYLHYHYKYEYLTDEEILPSDQGKTLEQDILTYSPLGKPLEKQKKEVGALSLKVSNKINEIREIEIIFPQNQLNDLIIEELKEIKQLKLRNIKL